jgi:hypothetical protein
MPVLRQPQSVPSTLREIILGVWEHLFAQLSANANYTKCDTSNSEHFHMNHLYLSG